MLALSDYTSSLGLTLFVLGLLVLVLPYCRRDWQWVRAGLMLLTTFLSVRYMAWRFTETLPSPAFSVDFIVSWAFACLEAVTIASSCIAALIMSRTLDRGPEATKYKNWWGEKPAPRIDVFITTYNEDRSLLERTIAGALATTYPNAKTFILDDGRRLWLQALCAAKGIGYITRADSAHAKAGNINNAFKVRMNSDDPPDFIAILDADFVPHQDFLDRAVSLFHDASVGLVQTPQYFFNPDPIQHNLGITHAYPDEQRFFFNHIEPARDAWGIAACCGTSSLLRVTALTEINGLPTESVTEDFLLTLRLSEHGHKTVYLNEPLTEGLAPEGLQEYIVQRGRWCLGMMQIVCGPYNPLSLRKTFTLRQRISVLDSFLFWSSTFPFRLVSMICPLLYWYFGIIVLNAGVPEILAYFTPAYAASLISLNWLTRGLMVPFLNDIAQLLGAYPITRAVCMGLFTRGPHKFNVTAKGGDRSKTIVQWPLLTPYIIIFVLTLGGLCFPIVSDYTPSEAAGDGKIVILIWTLYNMVLLALTMLVCIERPRPLHSMRHQTEQATLLSRQAPAAVWVLNLSREHARVRGPQGLRLGDDVGLALIGIGQVSAKIVEEFPDGYALGLLPTEQQSDLLTQKLHTFKGAPGAVEGSTLDIFAGIFQRLIAR